MIITQHKQSNRSAVRRFRKMSLRQKLEWLQTARLSVNMMSTFNRSTREFRSYWMPRFGGINFTGKHRTAETAFQSGLRIRRAWARELLALNKKA